MSTLSHDEDDLDEEMDEEVEGVAPKAAEPANDDHITFNGKRVSVDVGLKRCVALIEKGTGSWQHVAGKCACDCHASAARLDSVPRDSVVAASLQLLTRVWMTIGRQVD